jgi:hypothetical protein
VIESFTQRKLPDRWAFAISTAMRWAYGILAGSLRSPHAAYGQIRFCGAPNESPRTAAGRDSTAAAIRALTCGGAPASGLLVWHGVRAHICTLTVT